MLILPLIVFGLIFGSFVNAWVWRVKTERSIAKGRSMCPDCKHQLATSDLVPIFSWMWLKGRCRYCKKPISKQYPLVEVAVAGLFVVSYTYWPLLLVTNADWALFIGWLGSLVGLVALFIFDLKWMLLPDAMIRPTLAIAVLGRLIYVLASHQDIKQALISWFFAIVVASGLFKVIYHLSNEKWIGYGDVRLGWITGTLLASPSLAMLMIFSASLIGSAISIPIVLAKQKNLKAHIPFGPFLIIGTFISMLWGQKIIDWYFGILGN